MKILMITEGMDIGGAETHVLTLCRALLKRGDEITLLSSGGRYADELAGEGVRCLTAPTRGRDPRSLQKTAHAIRRVCREHAFDVIHAHTRGTAVLARSVTSLALVVTVHLDFHVGPLYRAIAELGDATLAVSEDLGDYIRREYKRVRGEIRITKNAVDPVRFPMRDALPRAIVHVSRLDRDRSLVAGLLCEIAPALLFEFPDARIYISGDGDDFSRIRRLANEANARLSREGVVLLGARTDVAEVLALGRIFVGVSRAALEAMSSCLCVVLAGNDGYGGLMHGAALEGAARTNFCARGEPPCTKAALDRDLRTLLHDEELCTAMGREGRELILCRYAPDSMAEDAHLAYLDAIRARRRRITLVGYYGYGNLGDEASREALRGRLADCEVTTLVAGKGAVGERNRYFSALSAIRQSGTVIFGGGNLFQDTSSSRSLRYYLALLSYAKARGCKTALLGGGIGELSAAGENKMREALPLFDHLACRTLCDIEYARRLGREGAISYLPDPVFTLTAQKAKKERLVVCFLHGGRAPKGRELALYNLCALGYSLVFVPLFAREDARLCRRYAARYGSFRRVETTDEALALLREATLAISERLHGGVFSLLCHTPCYLLCEDGKSRGLAHDTKAYADEHALLCPILPFTRYSEIKADLPLLRAKKETEGEDPFGFSKILKHFRSYWDAEVRR